MQRYEKKPVSEKLKVKRLKGKRRPETGGRRREKGASTSGTVSLSNCSATGENGASTGSATGRRALRQAQRPGRTEDGEGILGK